MSKLNIPHDCEHYTIPRGFTFISDGAFECCKELKSVTIPDSVTEVGSNAFAGCHALEKIVLPPRLVHIGSGAFKDCNSLTEITIPNTVKSIDEEAFAHCSSLLTILFADPEDGAQPCLEYIGKGAFKQCDAMQWITIPNSIKKIEENTFEGCIFLEAIDLPQGLEYIGDCAFSGCDIMSSITIPDSVSEIGGLAFLNCKALTEIKLPQRLRSIGARAFYSCTALQSITVPDAVAEIRNETFFECKSLLKVTLPPLLKRIGDLAFNGCHSLRSIAIPDTVACIGKEAFGRCAALEDITVPEAVTELQDGTFESCKSLRSAKLPKKLMRIENGAFFGCGSLSSVNIPQSVQFIGKMAFKGTALPFGEKGMAIVDGCLVRLDTEASVIRIPEGVRLIGSVVFPESAESIFFPSTVKYANYTSFEKTECYKNFPEQQEFYIIGDSTLIKYFGHSRSVAVIDGVKRISMNAFGSRFTDGFATIRYTRLEIPLSVEEMDCCALYGATFDTVSLFGMEFDREELCDGGSLFIKASNEISAAVKLAREFDPSVKINKRLKLAAAVTNYLNQTESPDNKAKEYLQTNRLPFAAELLIDKNKPEMLMRLIKSGGFEIGERFLSALIKTAKSKNKIEIAELLRRYKDKQ